MLEFAATIWVYEKIIGLTLIGIMLFLYLLLVLTIHTNNFVYKTKKFFKRKS